MITPRSGRRLSVLCMTACVVLLLGPQAFTSGTWTIKAPMPTARNSPGVGVIGGLIYAAGGYNGSHLANVESFNPATNTWTVLANRPTQQTSAAAAVSD